MTTEECQRLGLIPTFVREPWAIDTLRVIRNECRDGFSYDNHEISIEEQAQWWHENHGRVRCWLYATGTDGYVGFGLVRRDDDGRWLSSVGVVPAASGKGYGGAITADLVRRVDEPVYGSARLDNPAAMRLHREADWEEIGRDERLAHYRTMPHVYLDAVTENWAKHGWCLT